MVLDRTLFAALAVLIALPFGAAHRAAVAAASPSRK